MQKRTLFKPFAGLLGLATLFSLAAPALAAEPEPTQAPPSAAPTAQSIVVNGETVAVEAYAIDGHNYVKLRDVAQLLNGTDSQFSVETGEGSVILAETGKSYTPVGGELETGVDKSATCVPSDWKLNVDGSLVEVSVYALGGSLGNNFFQLRDLGEALGFDVDYNAETNSAVITSKSAGYKWVKSVDGNYYSLMEVVYCEKPVDAFYDDENTKLYQSMNIYVPAAYIDGEGTVNGYTAETAPIIFQNNCSGWRSSTPGNVDISYIEQGFVYVNCGARSRGAGENGMYGKAPCAVVDLKAAVRYLRANDSAIPGDKDKIVSVGTSGGGQMSSIFGASGNMEEYYPYLYEIGALGIEQNEDGSYTSTIRDDVFAAQCYCPITDIENADLAYAWWRFDSPDTQVTPMGASEPVTFTPFQKALEADLAVAFAEYVNTLNIKDEEGNVLTFDVEDGKVNPRSGSYYDQVLENMSNALNAFVTGNTDSEGKFSYSKTIGRGENAQTLSYDSLEDFLKTYGDTSSWLTVNEEGVYAVTDMAGFIAGTNLIRNKDIPGFDTLDLGAENDAFGKAGELAVHYSKRIADVLEANKDAYAKLEGYDAEVVEAYIEQGRREDIQTQTYLMNSTQIMLNLAGGTEEATIARHWRTRNGTADEHTSFTIAYNLAMAAKMAGAESVDYSLVWDMGHGSNEGTTTGTFIEWVNSICKE